MQGVQARRHRLKHGLTHGGNDWALETYRVTAECTHNLWGGHWLDGSPAQRTGGHPLPTTPDSSLQPKVCPATLSLPSIRVQGRLLSGR